MAFLQKFTAPALLFLLSSFLVGAQSSKDRSEILFTVNKRPVTTDEFAYLYRKNHQHKPEDFTKEKIEEYLHLFINYKLKVEEAISRGMDTTATFRKEYGTYREELLKPYMPDSKVVDSLVHLTYDRLKEEVNASHILIRLSSDAGPQDTLKAYKQISELRSRAVAGEDFATLAANHSQEPGAETTKGNLGYFTALQMVFPFEQAAYTTPVGQISHPIRTQFGYHILKVHDRQPSRGEVEVSHIMIRTQEGTEDVEPRDRIFDVYDQLQKGVSWEELCQEYSEDPASKSQGGKLRPFGVGAMASVPEFQDMAFALKEKGDISDPIQTQFGWHILKLESKIPLPPFEELKPSLTQRVTRDDRVRISREALRARMRREFNYSVNEKVRATLFAQADNTDENQSLNDQVLFTMQEKSYRVSDFLAFVKGLPSGTAHALSIETVDELYTDYVDKVQMELLEERVKLQSPDYKWLLKEYYEGILLFEIMEREVWNKAMEDSTGQRKYFDQHRGKYNADERMVGKVFATSVMSQIDELKRLIQNGQETAEFITANRIRQDSGAFQKKDRIIFSNIPWSAGVHSTEYNGVSYVIVIDRIIPPGPQTFDEARASVVSDYQSFLEDSWITELKRKFEVKVEKKAKKRVFARLVDNKG